MSTKEAPADIVGRLFRKKPVLIEAMQFTYPPTDEFMAWFGQPARMTKARHPGAKAELEVLTLEDGRDGQAKHVATEGDWIIKGVAGELYPCKPAIFELTYERAALSERAAPTAPT